MDYFAFFLGFSLGALIIIWFSIPYYYDAEKYRGLTSKVKTVGASNFAFTLFEDGSAEFKKAINPKEVVYLNKDQVLDVYDDLTRFYQTLASKVIDE